MENPFPGMNPWMEGQWRDAHQSLVVYARDALQPKLPQGLRARLEERVYLERPDELDPKDHFYPDVRIIERVHVAGGTGAAVLDDPSVATAEPLLMEIRTEPVNQGYIEIIDSLAGGKVITVIEFLSPSNKLAGEGHQQYVQKQRECRECGVNLVEIDLLRGGRRTLVSPEPLVPQSHRTPYRVCVWRAAKPLRCELYALPMRARLPAVRIPLREADDDIRLDLQPLLNQTYRNGAYDDTNYNNDPIPPLGKEDAAWAEELLRGKGLRK